jgi:dipeptidyl-peptidase-4
VTDSFPRQYARTQRLTLGEPRDLTVASDGSRVIFARSRGGADPVNCLWAADIATGEETMLVDPTAVMAGVAVDDVDLPPEERARRERMREGAGGITGYSLDEEASRVTFSLAGQLFVSDLTTDTTADTTTDTTTTDDATTDAIATTRHLDVPGPVFDPHLSPGGDRIAYVRGRELWSTDLEGDARRLAGPSADDPDTVSWGSADFVAAEEMDRYRGFWWSPDGATIAACRVDDAPVQVWYISNPARPSAVPDAVRYPAAGTPNPEVTLHLCPIDGGDPIDVQWDQAEFEYLAKVSWNTHGLAVTVLSRSQRDLEVRSVDPTTGATTPVFTDHDDAWIELVPGTGSLVDVDTPIMCADRDGARRLMIGDEPVSPAAVQIRAVVDASPDAVVVTGNPLDDASVQHVYRWRTNAGFEAVTDGLGVNSAVVGGDSVVLRSATVDEPGARWRLPGGAILASHAERPLVRPNVRVRPHTSTTPTTAVLLPHDHDGSPLPVLLDPYGGPHAQRVVRSHNAFCASQWFADQGFAVVVADGRGTPGRGTDFERAVLHDLAGGVLADQVTALHAAAEQHPELDLGRVAIRGWSFGGYLSALAVLERPDVFHAAIAGAPVTEWRLYDTCYTERYLGDPNERPDIYDANSLLPLAPKLTRPLLLIHGLADDNVVAAHTLQLSQALLAAGRPHEVLPLVDVTHMTPQEIVAENLLLHQLDFLRRSLGDEPAN